MCQRTRRHRFVFSALNCSAARPITLAGASTVLYSVLVRSRTVLCLLVLLPLLAAIAAPATAISRKERKEQEAKIAQLAPKYQQWLQSVALLLSDEERKSFLDLGEDYQRDAFIEKFWRSRDPYPETPRNEMQLEFFRRVRHADKQFQGFGPGWRSA